MVQSFLLQKHKFVAKRANTSTMEILSKYILLITRMIASCIIIVNNCCINFLTLTLSSWASAGKEGRPWSSKQHVLSFF